MLITLGGHGTNISVSVLADGLLYLNFHLLHLVILYILIAASILNVLNFKEKS
jgi:hypothetical protein